MSGRGRQSMFFLRLPDLKKLCCITLTLQEEDEELRSKQIKTCRELVMSYSDFLASPALDSFSEITVVMAVSSFQKGVLQAFGQRRSLQVGSPQCVFPGVLQCCLSYSLITRLAPSWNKAGLYLVTGKDFLTERGRLPAVSVELSTSEGQMCISIEANTVRLPPPTLEDFDLPPLVLRRFCSDLEAIVEPTSTGGAIWCHVLPSMKKGQIITISRQLPKDGPFKTYKDLRNHWNRLYGYRLPDLTEEEVVYCSVYFRLVGERLFTYPLSCIRLQPVQRCPQADLQGALDSFLSDVRVRLQSVCGFPARLTTKPSYCSVSLNSAATVKVFSGEQVSLTSSSITAPVLTAPPPPKPLKLHVGSQPQTWTPLSQQDGAQRLLGKGCGPGDRLTQSQGCRRDIELSSSSSSGYQSAPSLSSFSSSLALPQPASSLPSSILPPPPPPLSQTPVIPAPKLVPIFSNKCPTRHVNIALLQVQKQKEQLSGGREGRGRVTLPAVRRSTPTTGPSSFSSVRSMMSAASPQFPPPPTIPRFIRRPKPHTSVSPQLKGHLVKHIKSLSPTSESKPGLIPPPHLKIKFKSSSNTTMKASYQSSAPQPPTTSDVSNKDSASSSRGGAASESMSMKSRSAAQKDVDVEKMARNNQLSKLNSATLAAWLKERRVLVSAKHKKEELMLKVMSCLAEA